MVDFRCIIIPEPEPNSRVILQQPPQTKIPFISGSGTDTYICGNCEFVLALNVALDEIQARLHTEGGMGLVFKCPECNSFNELGPDIGG